MARYLILDSEAISALARARTEPSAAKRAQAVLTSAHRRNALVRIPAAALVEVFRGTAQDAALHWVLRRVGEVVATGTTAARHGGALLNTHRLDSSHAVDALVVGTAIALGGGLIATHDPKDLRRLASEHPNVQVVPV